MLETLDILPINKRPNRLLEAGLDLADWENAVEADSISKLLRTPSEPMKISNLVKKRLRRAPLLRRLIIVHRVAFYILPTAFKVINIYQNCLR